MIKNFYKAFVIYPRNLLDYNRLILQSARTKKTD